MDGNYHDAGLAPLKLVYRDGVGKVEVVLEQRELDHALRVLEADGEGAVRLVEVEDVADVAVDEVAVVLVLGLDDLVADLEPHAVERKTKQDAYSSLGQGRARFERELQRLSRFDYAAVVIETSLPDFLRAPAFSRMNPTAAARSMIAWSVKYRVCVFFAGDRRHGNALTQQLLEKFWKYRNGGADAGSG